MSLQEYTADILATIALAKTSASIGVTLRYLHCEAFANTVEGYVVATLAHNCATYVVLLRYTHTQHRTYTT